MRLDRRFLFLLLLTFAATLPLGCGQKSPPVIPQSKAQDTEARIQAINSNTTLSDQEKQQQIQRIRAESGP